MPSGTSKSLRLQKITCFQPQGPQGAVRSRVFVEDHAEDSSRKPTGSPIDKAVAKCDHFSLPAIAEAGPVHLHAYGANILCNGLPGGLCSCCSLAASCTGELANRSVGFELSSGTHCLRRYSPHRAAGSIAWRRHMSSWFSQIVWEHAVLTFRVK